MIIVIQLLYQIIKLQQNLENKNYSIMTDQQSNKEKLIVKYLKLLKDNKYSQIY